MMEFTLSRVVLAVCGILLLGAVISPFTVSEDNFVSEMYQDEADSIASAVDSFCESQQDISMIDMGRLLPTEDCSLSFDGRMIVLSDGKNEYTAFCSCEIESDRESYDSNDMVFLKKEDGKVVAIKFR